MIKRLEKLQAECVEKKGATTTDLPTDADEFTRLRRKIATDVKRILSIVYSYPHSHHFFGYKYVYINALWFSTQNTLIPTSIRTTHVTLTCINNAICTTPNDTDEIFDSSSRTETIWRRPPLARWPPQSSLIKLEELCGTSAQMQLLLISCRRLRRILM